MGKKAGVFFDYGVELLSSLFLFAMFVVVVYGVYSRHMVVRPAFWTDELARYCMFYMVMVGGAASITENTHPALTFLTEAFTGGWKVARDVWVELLVLLTIVLLFVGGLDMVLDARNARTVALRMYYSRVYFAVPLGCCLMAIATLRRIRRIVAGRAPEALDKRGSE